MGTAERSLICVCALFTPEQDGTVSVFSQRTKLRNLGEGVLSVYN